MLDNDQFKRLRTVAASSVCAVFAVLATGCAMSSETEEMPQSWQDKIENRLKVELTQTGLPSLQVAIGFQGDLVYENAVGFADKERRKRATTQTQYRTASISKWLTGTAAFKLVDSGKLDLHASIQTYCPEYPEKSETITTRHLLSHTSGIRHYADHNAMREAAKTAEDRDRVDKWIAKNDQADQRRYTDTSEPIAVFKDDPLVFNPGEGFQYSSFGYRVLGCVISGAAGQPYRKYMQDSLFAPLNMTLTLPEDSAAIPEGRAELYAVGRNKMLRPAPPRDISANLPAGGHLSTATDLIRFTNAFSRYEVISEASIKTMSSEPVAENGKVMPVGYGHGVDFMSDFPGSLGHGGRQSGTTTLLIYLPEYDVSVAVMANASGWRGITPLAGDILSILQTHAEELK